MPEKTKEELSEEINKILGINIDFTRLPKDDLATLHEALAKFKEAQEFPLPLLDRPLGEILEKRIGDKPLRETSLREILGLPKDRKGLFGFGILGRLFTERGAEKSEPET